MTAKQKTQVTKKAVAEKLVKVNPQTHFLLKVRAAKEKKTMGELLTQLAEEKK